MRNWGGNVFWGMALLWACGCANLRSRHQQQIPSKPMTEAPTNKLDAALNSLVSVAQKGSNDDLEKYAQSHGLTVKDGKVKVVVIANSEAAVGGLKKALTDTGAEVATDFTNRIYAMVAIAKLTEVAAMSDVWNIAAEVAAFGPSKR
jgi:hypothetical protein